MGTGEHRGRRIAYLALLALPAAALAWCGIRLLAGEHDRMRRAAEDAAQGVLSQAAGALRDFVSDTERELTRQLMALPETNRVAALRDLSETMPLIRTGFVWDSERGVLWPTEKAATEDEREFLRRYASLFRGEQPWEDAHAEDVPTVPLLAKTASPRFFDLRRAKAQSLPAAAPVVEAAGGKPKLASVSGWRPWFEGDRLYLLGWIGDPPSESVYGAELETAALFSRIPAMFAGTLPKGYAIDLLDGNGKTQFRLGDEPGKALFRQSLAPELPHWTMALTAMPPLADSNRFMLFGVLLLALLLGSLAVGGLLLARDAQRERRDAMRKTGFVSNVSHELKTPLTSIRMYAELLEENRVPEPERQKRFLGIIASESRRLSRLVNNVLDFSRLEQNRKRYAPEKIELAAFCQEVISSLREALDKYGITAELEGDGAIIADRDALSQVLVNLLDNAGKYAASGKTVEVSIRDGVIDVMDRGPGIAPRHVKRIFDDFYRADESLTAKTAGSGLGLGIARRLMRGMCGDVVYSPREGGGSVFTIRFGGNA